MIKFVASDVDGTLLLDGREELPARTLAMISALDEKNIVFAAASGRSYHDLRRLFAPVWDKMVFICHDGALVMRGGETLLETPVDRRYAQDFLQDIWLGTKYDVLVSGKHVSYFRARTPAFEAQMRSRFANHVAPVDDFSEIEEEIFKIGVYDAACPAFARPLVSRYNRAFVYDAYQRCGWQEFVAKGANKGAAVAFLQQALGIPKSCCMAFGDNDNDLSMLKQVGAPYAMAHGKYDVKKLCRRHTKRVEPVLEQLLTDEKSLNLDKGVEPSGSLYRA